MPKNKNVFMNIEGVDFELNDTNFNHFKSQTKHQQKAIKQIILLKISEQIDNNIHNFLDDEKLIDYQAMTKEQQKALKQSMIFKLLENNKTLF